MSAPLTGPDRTRGIARALSERLDEPQREQVAAWARRLLEIHEGRGLPPAKAWQALDATSDTVAALLTAGGPGLVELAWNDRSWPARLGIVAGTAAFTAVAGAGAGVMAAGGVLGVPLWVVFGGGAPAARLLLDELDGAAPARPAAPRDPADDGPVVEADWEWDAPRLASTGRPRREHLREEPLWRVFRQAYRDARARREPDPPWAEGT